MMLHNIMRQIKWSRTPTPPPPPHDHFMILYYWLINIGRVRLQGLSWGDQNNAAQWIVWGTTINLVGGGWGSCRLSIVWKALHAGSIIKLISDLYIHFVILNNNNNNMEMISIKINTPGLLGSQTFPAVAIYSLLLSRDRCTGSLNLYYWNIKYSLWFTSGS